jgi:general secretion pathway protein I
LVEVLVAFALVALGTLLILRIGLETAARARHLDATDLLLDEAEGVVMLRVAAGTLHAGVEQGRFSDGRVWSLSTIDVGPAAGWHDLPPLWRVRLTEGGPDGQLVYMTLITGGLGGG